MYKDTTDAFGGRVILYVNTANQSHFRYSLPPPGLWAQGGLADAVDPEALAIVADLHLPRVAGGVQLRQPPGPGHDGAQYPRLPQPLDYRLAGPSSGRGCFRSGCTVLPIPFILLLPNPLRRRANAWPGVGPCLRRAEARAVKYQGPVERYGFCGLLTFVGIPLPGTGAWTGALITAVPETPLWRGLADVTPGCFALPFAAAQRKMGDDAGIP